MGLRHVATAEEETSTSFSSVCRLCLHLQRAAGCHWGFFRISGLEIRV